MIDRQIVASMRRYHHSLYDQLASATDPSERIRLYARLKWATEKLLRYEGPNQRTLSMWASAWDLLQGHQPPPLPIPEPVRPKEARRKQPKTLIEKRQCAFMVGEWQCAHNAQDEGFRRGQRWAASKYCTQHKSESERHRLAHLREKILEREQKQERRRDIVEHLSWKAWHPMEVPELSLAAPIIDGVTVRDELDGRSLFHHSTIQRMGDQRSAWGYSFGPSRAQWTRSRRYEGFHHERWSYA